MKTNWSTKKLGEVCKIYNGGTPDTKKLSYWGSDHFWITPKDMGSLIDMYVEETSRKITDAGLKNSSAKILPPNSIILSSRAPIGYLAINKVPMATNQGCKGLIPNKELGFLFLFYFLFNSTELLNKLGSGTTFKELSGSKLAEIEIPLPPLPEQQRIVKFLDEIFEKITKAKENTEKNLQNAKDLFESYLQSVFANPGEGWEEKSLEELGKITSSKRIYKKEYVKDGIPFYRIKEIKELAHGKNISLELFISRKRYKEIKNIFGVPLIGDILMTAVGTIGEIYVVKNDEEFYFKDGNILWFKNFNSVDPYFLKFVLMSFVEQINKLSKGSAYSALTIEKIEKHKIFLPKSIVEQKSIVAKLDALSEQTKKLEAIYKQKLADLEELKKAVLRSAFAGKP
jgi:type I restriction enzyme S subunit